MTWIQITAGRGPAECALAVEGILGRLRAAAERAGLKAILLDAQPAERGGLLSALLDLEGQDAEAFVRSWEGTAQWTCRSPLRPTHGRKNWFVGIARVATPGTPGGLDARDVAFETLKAGGKGGQHVNKTESAVRAVHRPTGLAVLARDERSQHANKRLALARLAARLAEADRERGESAEAARWRRHDALTRGDARRVFRGERFEETR